MSKDNSSLDTVSIGLTTIHGPFGDNPPTDHQEHANTSSLLVSPFLSRVVDHKMQHSDILAVKGLVCT